MNKNTNMLMINHWDTNQIQMIPTRTPDFLISQCFTAPFIRCNEKDPYTPIWNLHIHSKHTHVFKSETCDCPL